MRTFTKKFRRAFTLVEVIIAVAILGVGLVMVASIFPVAATWTRQSAEETIASQVALNAVNILKVKFSNSGGAWQPSSYYPVGAVVVYNGHLYSAKTINSSVPTTAADWELVDPAGAVKYVALASIGTPVAGYNTTAGYLYTAGKTVYSGTNLYTCILAHSDQTPPNATYWTDLGAFSLNLIPKMLPLTERAYAFGTDSPYPATTPANANYYWTAILRPGGSNDIAAYICVFRKGDANQQWTGNVATAPWVNPPWATEITGARGTGEPGVPTLVDQAFSAGTFNTATNQIVNAVPPVGFYGIGARSGTVFKQGITADASYAAPTTFLRGQTGSAVVGDVSTISESVIFAPAADGSSGSPLVYIYQTKISF